MMKFASTLKRLSAGHFVYLFLLLLILAGACKKSNPIPPGGGGTDTTDTTGGPDTSVTDPKDYNIFGIYVGQSASEDKLDFTGNPRYQYGMTNAKDVSLAKFFGVKYYRLHVSHDRWITDSGKSNFLNYMQRVSDSGLAAVLNVNWNETDQTPDPFPDAGEYSIFLKDVLDSLNAKEIKPAVIVVENEPANFNNHVIDTSSDAGIDADVAKYINELAAAIPVCRSFKWFDGSTGVKICDGGYMVRQMTFVTYDWLKNVKKNDNAAKTFANNSMPPSIAKDIQKTKYPDYVTTRLRIAYDLINGMKNLDLDYINLHWQEPAKVRSWDYSKEGGDPYLMGTSPDSISKDVLTWVVQYFNENLPHVLMSNEIGQLNTSVILNKRITDNFLAFPDNVFPIVCWYDADGNNDYDVKSLHNTLFDDSDKAYYELRPNGIQFQTTVKSLK